MTGSCSKFQPNNPFVVIAMRESNVRRRSVTISQLPLANSLDKQISASTQCAV
jgi:hypothetical protein